MNTLVNKYLKGEKIMESRKVVFITGIAGFLGSHLADAFLSLGWVVKGCDSLIGGYIENVPKAADFVKVDCLDLDRLTDSMKGVDLVYHTACTAYEGLSVFSPSYISLNTFQISVNMMTAAINSGVSRVVHCSSMARYGSQDKTPFTENMICKPQDPYGIAKYSAELMLQNMAQTHGIELVIAVPHNIIGPRQKFDDPYRNVASIMINMMLQGRQPIIYGDGNQIRCFSSISDDIDCLMNFALDPKAKGEIFNIGPDEGEMTINNLASIIADQIGFELKPVYVDGRPQEVKHATCSADKIRTYFGYQTKSNTIETICSMIESIREIGPKPFTYHLPLEIITDQTPKTWTKKIF